MLCAAADGRVGHRPVNRQAKVAPQLFERLLVLHREPCAQLDEVRARHREWVLAGFLRRYERGVERQRRIAAHPKIVLHAPLGRQAVVVPSHRIEHGLPPHALETGDDVGVGVGEDVTDVQRAAHRRRRGVDRKDLGARPRAIEAIERIGVPALGPFLLETLERWLVGNHDGMELFGTVRHEGRPPTSQTKRRGAPRTTRAPLAGSPRTTQTTLAD